MMPNPAILRDSAWRLVPPDFDWDARSVDASGGTVSGWPARRGGVAAIQVTAGKRPARGGDRIVFARDDGNPGSFDCLATAAINLASTDKLTIISVNSHTENTGGVVIESSDSYSLSSGTFAGFRSAAAAKDLSVCHKGNVGACYRSSVEAPAGVCVMTQRSDFALAAANEIRGKLNGAPYTLATSGSGENTSVFGNFAFNIGARANGTGVGLRGMIGRIGIWKAYIADATLQGLERAMMLAYGVSP